MGFLMGSGGAEWAVGQEAKESRPKPVQKSASELIAKQDKPQVRPRVLEKADPEKASIYISLSKQRAYLKIGEELAVDTPVSTGKRKGMTPAGTYQIIQKDANHRSNIYGNFVNSKGRIVRAGVSARIDSAPSGTHFQGAPMKFFMRLTNDGIGMHAGHLPGYPASHGCIRLPAEIAPLIYNSVKIGTPVVVGE